TKQQRHKRKLPALAAHLAPTVPPDDPSKHQGRTRTTPHVDGQWAAYVYVPIALRGSSTAALRRVVERAVGIAKTAGETGIVPVHTLGSSGSGSGDVVEVCDELHVSLTRPFFLRAYQREEMKRAVRDVAKAHSPFVASFAAFSDLTNDERTRTFLSLEVGGGHQEFRALSDALTPALHSFRQKEYYEQPRFHTSFAWVLRDPQAQSSPTQAPEPLETLSAPTSVEDTVSASTNSFPTIPRLPESVVPALNAELGSQLKGPAGIFDVGEVRIRIGKDVFSWTLSG
ncbi:U6 snRNA phosphodiesterase Usb1, partial [Russula ochroleuca]